MVRDQGTTNKTMMCVPVPGTVQVQYCLFCSAVQNRSGVLISDSTHCRRGMDGVPVPGTGTGTPTRRVS